MAYLQWGVGEMADRLILVHNEIIKCLLDMDTSFAHPVSSQELGTVLNVTPSYIRGKIRSLIKLNLVGVRHGRGGGYYLRMGEKMVKSVLTSQRD